MWIDPRRADSNCRLQTIQDVNNFCAFVLHQCGPDGKPLPPYQDDRLTERGYGRHGPGTWDPYVSGTSVQSSMRTYNAPGGSIYAEVR